MDEDDELRAIRERRMAELRGKAGGPGGPAGAAAGGQQQYSRQAAEEQEQRKKEMEEARNLMLRQILTTEAKARLSNIALVKPDKARKIEDMLIMNAQRGAISEKIDEEKLRGLLEQISEKTQQESKVTFQRRRLDDDD